MSWPGGIGEVPIGNNAWHRSKDRNTYVNGQLTFVFVTWHMIAKWLTHKTKHAYKK